MENIQKSESLKSIDIMKVKMVKEASLDYDYVQQIECASMAYELFLQFGLSEQAEETLCMACLNARSVVIGLHEVARGSLTVAPVQPRDVFKRALLNNAACIIIAHNHPTGELTPSSQDKELTKKLKSAGDIMGIKLLDHLIVSPRGFYSFAAEGQLCK